MGKRQNIERAALHRIACGLHRLARVRELSTPEHRVFVMAQRALTPEVSVTSIESYLSR